jgi:uncharacterized lipoprotein YmbA
MMKRVLLPMCCLWLLQSCATSRPDHFYILIAQPGEMTDKRTAPRTPVLLSVSLPSPVDRAEMVLNTGTDAVAVLEHERWAAPLSELVAQTLARDLERRRADLLVGGRSDGRLGAADFKVTIDVVQLSIFKGGRASIETHWRILEVRTGKEMTGGDVFGALSKEDSYAAAAQALSDCLGLLADRLVAQLAAG